MKVTNTSQHRIICKIKTTQPKWYAVRPNQRMLDVGEWREEERRGEERRVESGEWRVEGGREESGERKSEKIGNWKPQIRTSTSTSTSTHQRQNHNHNHNHNHNNHHQHQ